MNWQIILIILAFIFLIGIILWLRKHRFRKLWIFKRIKETPAGKTTSYLVQDREFKSQSEAENFARSLR